MRATLIALLCSLASADAALAAEAVGDMIQLQRLNRESQQALQQIQQSPPDTDDGESPSQNIFRRNLDRHQQANQHALQERQRRQVLMQRQRNRIGQDPPWRQRMNAINRQWQYQLQQQHQLNRFQMQQRGLKR